MRAVSKETRAKISTSLLGHPMPKETRAKISASLLGRPVSEETRAKLRTKHVSSETRAKIRASLFGHPVSNETRAKFRAAHLGKHHTEETKRKMAVSQKGRVLSKETREKMRLNALAQWSNPESREKVLNAVRIASKAPDRCLKISKAMKGRVPPKATIEAMKKANRARKGQKHSSYKIKDKKLYHQKLVERWKQDTYIANQMKARNLKPNKSEIRLQELLDKHFPNEWKFVGDGQLIIGGKCPDFANINGKKSLIELFGLYWHKNENPQVKIDHYREYGYRCIVIWENELKDKEQLMQKIGNFKDG